jgi:hypothetical protein
MPRAASYFLRIIAIVVFLALALSSWTIWHAAVRWLNSPTAGTSGGASRPSVVVGPIPTPQNTAGHEPGPEDFVGTWIGKWDSTYALKLTMRPANGRSLAVVYEHEETPGQPMISQNLHPTPNGRVAKMPRAALVMTLSETQANTARLDGNFDLGGSFHHTATLTRVPVSDAETQVDWLAGAASGQIILDIKANIDGSDILHLTQSGAKWEHRGYQWPTDVSVNKISWDPSSQPELTKTGLENADFSTAKVVGRMGRDIIAVETHTNGLDIAFDDGPAGADAYEVKIAMDRKDAASAATAPTGDPIYLDVAADIDGSDVMVISADGARWYHRAARWATNVKVNDKLWDVQSTELVRDLGLAGADLNSASVAERSGRGVIVMEKSVDAVTIYFADGLRGAGHFHVKLRFDQKTKSASH